MNNPFLIVGYQGPEYFCDREKETEVILSALHNGRNITLVSPRRMGKTGLIKNVFYTLQEKEKNAKCFYLDIFSTQNLREFVALLGREILGKLDSLSQSTLKTLLSFFKSCRPVITMDELSGIPSVSLDIVPSKEEETLKEIFDYLRQSGRECYLAIDEFQQIARYPEKNVEAVLRTHIQKCTNTNFVFAGSQRHMMQNIFFSASRPFYQSASFLNLGPIEERAYHKFVREHFEQAGKRISDECIARIYGLFEGHTWYMQTLLNRLYEQAVPGETIIPEEANSVLHATVDAQQSVYQSMVAMLSERQKELLFAVGKERRATEITSADFITRHGLYSSSSVQSAARQLLDKELLTKDGNIYQVYDRFFGLWIAQTYGTGYCL